MKPLTEEQVEALKIAPLGTLSNRLQIAFALSNVRQSEACEVTGLSPSAMSKLVRGAYQSLDLSIAYKLADFFGVTVEDLFPSRESAKAS